MSEKIPYLIQGKNIILVIDGESYAISKDTHMNYGNILEALAKQEWDTLRELVEPTTAIEDFGSGHISIVNGEVLWQGKPLHNALTSRMLEMFKEGFPIEPMVEFMENLMENPSKRSVDQLYDFLDKNKLPITEDGYFLAYKRVRGDYMDVHSGTISNKVGEIVSMDRNLVDDNPDSHCSTGLHFCSFEYLGTFGGPNDPVMILKINPRDVVSIPTDYNGSKGRCCEYQIVGEAKGDPKDAFAKVVNGDYGIPEMLEENFPKPIKPSEEESVSKSMSKTVSKSEKPVNKPEIAPVVAKGKGSLPHSWPFPKSVPKEGSLSGLDVDIGFEEKELYDLVRVSNDLVEHENMTLTEAREKVAKNLKNRKALLKIVRAGTDEEVQ